MSTSEANPLFELGLKYFREFSAELAAYGIPIDPRMELRQGKGLLCNYNLEDGHIYLAVPDPSTPMGRLHAVLLASSLGCDDEDELIAFFRIFIPRLIAHELGHHLRQRHGAFGDDLWEEEQVANQLATAMTRHRLSPEEKEFARRFLRRALEALTAKLGAGDAATVSYHDVLDALNASGRIDDSALERIQVTQQLFALRAEEIVAEQVPSLRFGQALARREAIIREINTEYADNFAKYTYYHVGWLYLDLTSHTAEYVDDFAREHLHVEPKLLPALDDGPPVSREGVRMVAAATDEVIQAFFLAFHRAMPIAPAAGRWFYKRYRHFLWARLQAARLLAPSQATILRREASFFLESWDEGRSDALDTLATMVPAEVRRLFPRRIEASLDPNLDVVTHLCTPTDRRLYRHVVLGEPDEAAESTLYRLALLDRTDVFRSIPAESTLALVRSFCRVRLAPGEPVIHQGDINDDVFFLSEGELQVWIEDGGEAHPVGTIRPGEVFGEMAFFSRDVRTATVRATVPSECFVVKDSDLLRISFKHPSVLMQMAGALARRLDGMNRRAAQVSD